MLDLYLWESIADIMKLMKDKWRGKNAMKIKMGFSLMISQIVGVHIIGELAKVVWEIVSLDRFIYIYIRLLLKFKFRRGISWANCGFGVLHFGHHGISSACLCKALIKFWTFFNQASLTNDGRSFLWYWIIFVLLLTKILLCKLKHIIVTFLTRWCLEVFCCANLTICANLVLLIS